MAGNDSDTKLLLNCDGENGHTTFTDSSVGGNHGNATVNQTAQGDTSVKKFGTASLLLDGTDDWLEFSDHADWDLLLQTNFTIDLWVKHDLHSSEEAYVHYGTDINNHWIFYHGHGDGDTHGLRFFARNTGSGVFLDTDWGGPDGGEISDTDWHHAAAIKVGNHYGCYLDGTQVNHTENATTDTYSGDSLYIATYGGAAAEFDGHFDEIRITWSNPFGASPNAGLSDSIEVPTEPYSESAADRFSKIEGRNVSSIYKFNGVLYTNVEKVSTIKTR